MQAPDSFYVVLPSNSSAAFYPGNTHSNYIVKLAKTIIVNEDYEVALVETFFQRNWYNVTSKDCTVEIVKTADSIFKSIKVQEGYYEKPDYLVQEINQKIMESFGQQHGDIKPSDKKQVTVNEVIDNIHTSILNTQNLDKKRQELIEYQQEVTEAAVLLEKAKAEFERADNAYKTATKAADDRLDTFIRLLDTYESQLERVSKYPDDVFPGDAVAAAQRIAELTELIRVEKMKDSQEKASEIRTLEGYRIKRSNSEKTLLNRTSNLTSKKKILEIKTSEFKVLELQQKTDEDAREKALSHFFPQKAYAAEKGIPYLIYEAASRKVAIVLPKYVHIKLSRVVQRMLGFKPREEYISNSEAEESYIFGELTADMRTDLNSFCIYSDVVRPQYLGEILAPLLRIVHLSDTDGMRITKTYPQSFYLPLNQNYIDSIEIDIRDMYGDAIRFSDDDVVVNVLHFRRKNS